MICFVGLAARSSHVFKTGSNLGTVRYETS